MRRCVVLTGRPSRRVPTLQSNRFCLAAIATAASIVPVVTARGADSTWILDGNGDWSVGGNWSAGMPNGVGDDATFAGAILAPRTVNQNVSGLTVGSMVFNNANAYTIAGSNSIMFDAPELSSSTIDVSLGSHAIQTPVVVNDTVATVPTAGAELTLSGVISGPAGIAKRGEGTTVFSGAQSNTYSGMTFANQGTLVLSKPGAVAIPAGVMVGDGIGGAGADVLRLAASHQINGNVTIAPSGLLDLNGFAEEINGLNATVAGAQINLGGAGLTVNGGFFLGTISGAGNFAKDGPGQLTFTGGSTNTYSGFTVVTGGSVVLGRTGTDNSIPGSFTIGVEGGLPITVTYTASDQIAHAPGSTVSVNALAVLDLNGFSDTIANLSVTDGSVTTGGGTLTLNGALITQFSPIPLTGGTIAGKLALAAGTHLCNIADGTAVDDLKVNAVISGAGGLNKSGPGRLVLSGSNTYVGATDVTEGQLVLNQSLTSSVSLTISDASAVLTAGGTKLIKTGTVNVAGTGTLDLTDNKLITSSPLGTFTAGAYTDVGGLVDRGRGNASNAQWNGGGIITTDTRAVNNNDLVSIGTAKVGTIKGIADTATATFAGQTVLGSDTIAMVTWGGDANLDGKINIDDYGQIDFNVGSSGSVFGWFNGDFNYDGKINIDDYGIIDFNVTAQDSIFPTAGGPMEGAAAVPESTSLWLAAIGAAAASRRSRRIW